MNVGFLFFLINDFKTHNETELVTPACIGRRVLVANANNEVATAGILRFVGPLEGQNGIFCGVELPEPLGKNDGSYRGMISCSFMKWNFMENFELKLYWV